MMKKSFKNWIALSKQIYKDNWKCVIATIIVCFVTFLARPLFTPVFLNGLFNRLSQGDRRSFWQFVIICFLVLLVISAVSYVLIVFSDAWFIRLTDQGSINALKELYKIPYYRVENRFSKEEQFNRIMNGCSGATGVFALGTQTITAFICCVIICMMFLSLSRWFCIPVFLLIGAEWLRLKFELPFYQKVQLSLEKTMADVHGDLYTMVMLAEPLAVIGETKFCGKKFQKDQASLWNQKKEKQFQKIYWDIVSDSSMLVSTIILYQLLGQLSEINRIVDGTVASSVQFLQSFQGNVMMIRENIAELPNCFVTIDRLKEILEQEKGESEAQSGKETTTVIDVKNLTIKVQEKTVLNNLSMQVEKGEKVAVIGANGSGKSTLIKAILGEYEIKDGQILLFGKDMQQLRTEERGKEIGYCPSVNQLYSVSGEDNIKMALWGECEKAKQLKSLPLDSLTEKMSEGEKKRISITRAGAGRKLLIIADEPEASLNQELADKYMEWLLKQAETVVVVTHRKESLSGFTRIIYMEDLKG